MKLRTAQVLIKTAAEALDVIMPLWYSLIDLARLDISDPHHCILAQLYGDYHQAPKHLCGTICATRTGIQRAFNYDMLTLDMAHPEACGYAASKSAIWHRLWKHQITERVKAAAKAEAEAEARQKRVAEAEAKGKRLAAEAEAEARQKRIAAAIANPMTLGMREVIAATEKAIRDNKLGAQHDVSSCDSRCMYLYDGKLEGQNIRCAIGTALTTVILECLADEHSPGTLKGTTYMLETYCLMPDSGTGERQDMETFQGAHDDWANPNNGNKKRAEQKFFRMLGQMTERYPS